MSDYKPTPIRETLGDVLDKFDQQHAEAVMMVGHLNKLRHEARLLAWSVVEENQGGCQCCDSEACTYCRAKAFLKASGGEDVR